MIIASDHATFRSFVEAVLAAREPDFFDPAPPLELLSDAYIREGISWAEAAELISPIMAEECRHRLCGTGSWDDRLDTPYDPEADIDEEAELARHDAEPDPYSMDDEAMMRRHGVRANYFGLDMTPEPEAAPYPYAAMLEASKEPDYMATPATKAVDWDSYPPRPSKLPADQKYEVWFARDITETWIMYKDQVVDLKHVLEFEGWDNLVFMRGELRRLGDALISSFSGALEMDGRESWVNRAARDRMEQVGRSYHIVNRIVESDTILREIARPASFHTRSRIRIRLNDC